MSPTTNVGTSSATTVVEGPEGDAATTTAPPTSTIPLDSPFVIVDPAAPTGGDGSSERPFNLPNDALEVAEPGTTIYLRAGAYVDTEQGATIIRRSGTADAWIKIKPYPGEEVHIEAGGEWGNGFEIITSSFIEISGFAMTGREDSIHGSGVLAKDESHDLRILDNEIEGFGGAGISTVHSSMIFAEGNVIRGNGFRSFFQGSGISIFEAVGPVAESGASNVIRNNLVVGNYNAVLSRSGLLTDGNCIIIDFLNETGYSGDTVVENNVCIDNGGRGIHVFNSSHVLARNNTLIGNVRSEGLNGGKAEMVAASSTDVQFVNNLVLNREEIRSFQVSKSEDVTFSNNFVAAGPLPPGDSNGLLTSTEQLLATLSGDAERGAHRPVDSAAILGLADPTLQTEFDAGGERRPSPGAIGAYEPIAR